MKCRPDLKETEASYSEVLKNGESIDNELETSKIGRKDTPFDKTLMDNMLSAWGYMDVVIRKKEYDLFGERGDPDMLKITHRVHYGSTEFSFDR